MSNFNLNKSKKISLNINADLYNLSKSKFKSDRFLKNKLNSIGSFADLIECLLISYLNHPNETLKEINFDKYIYTYNKKILYPCKHVDLSKFKKYELKNNNGGIFIE